MNMAESMAAASPVPEQPAETRRGDLAGRRQIEIDFWRDSPVEKPGAESLLNQLDKSADALILVSALARLGLPRVSATHALELGAGQGWGSCVLKRLRPELHVTATDISSFAVESTQRWERIYSVEVDAREACTSDRLPFEDASIDFVFCFAAAHHFVTHAKTLRELTRVLKPGGVVAYLYEPTSPRLLYRRAYKRVNAKRPEVPEDVLVPSLLRRQAAAAGLGFKVDYWPATLKRGRMAALYYAVLAVVPGLRRVLPCTANLIFEKPAVEPGI